MSEVDDSSGDPTENTKAGLNKYKKRDKEKEEPDAIASAD